VPLAALALLVVITVLVLRTKGLVNPGAAVAISDKLWALNDFLYTMYYPAVAFVDGVNPYDPDAYRAAYPVKTFPLYSPLTLVLYAPLAVLPVDAARWVYVGIMILLYGLLAALLLRFAGRKASLAAVLWLWALILASRPGHQNLLNGQSTAQAVLGVLLALEYSGRKPMLAGVGLFLATLKPTFGVPLVVLLLCQGHVRTVIASGVAIGLGVAAVVGVLALQHGGLDSVISAVQANLGVHGQHPNTNLATSYSRIDLAMFFARWSGHVPGAASQATLAAGLLVVAGAALWLRNRAHPELGMCTWSSALICFAVPLCIYHQSYDSLTLAIPAVALTVSPRWRGAELAGPARTIVLLCALVPLGNYLATDGLLKRLALHPEIWRYVTVVNATIIVIGFLACLVAMRNAPRPGSRA
jgi:hypothetical protein